MLDSEFKQDIVKILQKLTSFHANKNSEELDRAIAETFSKGMELRTDRLDVMLDESGTTSPIDLSAAFSPSRIAFFDYEGDDTSFTYQIVGENAINAYIQNEYELVVPALTSALSSYELYISITTEMLGNTQSELVEIDFEFS